MTKVCCTQLAPVVGDLHRNIELSTEAIRQAVGAGAEVVVLPELTTSGYLLESLDEARSVAVGLDHELFAGWQAAAGAGRVVVAGFCERAADGLVYNSAVVLDGLGARTFYRKTHLWDREKLIFTPGVEPPPVVETSVGRIGVMICYDMEFPELTRGVALRGAELLAVPTNWPLVDRPAGERPAEVIIAMATARINHLAIACCDRQGVERGQEWTEGSTIIDEQGWVVASSADGPVVVADLDLAAGRDKVISERNHALDDRRPELYSDLSV